MYNAGAVALLQAAGGSHCQEAAPPTAVTLTDDERQRLNTLARRSRSAPQLARRARIILACADRQPTVSIARRLHVSAIGVWAR